MSIVSKGTASKEKAGNGRMDWTNWVVTTTVSWSTVVKKYLPWKENTMSWSTLVFY